MGPQKSFEDKPIVRSKRKFDGITEGVSKEPLLEYDSLLNLLCLHGYRKVRRISEAELLIELVNTEELIMNDKDKGWLEAQIEANNIKFFNYDEFSKIEKVGKGGFGTVHKAYWESRRM